MYILVSLVIIIYPASSSSSSSVPPAEKLVLKLEELANLERALGRAMNIQQVGADAGWCSSFSQSVNIFVDSNQLHLL
jgi:hypothetical protein